MTPDEWNAYNVSKWKQVEGTLPGLSFSQHGENDATFILGFSGPDFEQRVIIGRPAKVVARPYMGAAGRAVESGHRDEDVVDGGENVSFSEVKRIVDCWRSGARYEPPKPVRR